MNLVRFLSCSEEQSKISPADKALVRENILVFMVQVPPLLRVQFGECLKTIIHVDYPEQWPGHWVKHNLQDQQVYGALFVLRILARKYECSKFVAAAISRISYQISLVLAMLSE